jgi:S1-C subfamily serine protease
MNSGVAASPHIRPHSMGSPPGRTLHDNSMPMRSSSVNPGAGSSKSPLLKVMVALVGVAAVAILTVGLVRFLSNDVEPERTHIASGLEDNRQEDERVDERVDEHLDDDYPDDVYVESNELTPLTAREVYDNNVDAVFTVFIRLPEEWNLTELEVSMYYRYYFTLPSGIYVPHGSGFFANADGVAVTNHHVVRDIEHMVARTHDGEIHQIVGYYSYDINNDIAIIQVEGSGFSHTTFSEIPVGVGDYAFAIGSSAGDPNTFTSGVVSRFAQEIQFDIYTVKDVIQFTAPIYGGNSGGPVFNHFGQVLGVVSAGSIERASVGFAVRIDRVDLAGALNASITPFPLDDGTMFTETPRDYYDSFPTVPTLQSVNDGVFFLIGGNAADLELDEFGYERTYTYSTLGIDGLSIVSQYESALLERGFIWQDDVEIGGTDLWFYYYHQADNISVSILYISEYNMMMIAIGRGNIYEDVYL